MRRFLLTAFAAMTFSSTVFSQTENFSTDKVFFEKTAQQYERWLAATGLNVLMQVEKIDVKKDDSELELLLQMRTTDVDIAVAEWQALRRKFSEGQPDSMSLERLLFETFVRQMQIPAAQGNIQIYVKDAQGQYIPCFAVFIWSEDEMLKTDSRFNICKARPLDVSVSLPPVKTTKGKTTTVGRPLSTNAVFDHIMRYAREQFERTTCDGRYPQVEMDYAKSKGSVLVFTVTDLCRVVLRDETKSVWCRTVALFGGTCNDIRRERLIFTFNYEATPNGYRLTGEVQGLFGSGVFKPRTGGYMDMEPDFVDYLTDYANSFQGRLQAYLQR